MNNYLGNTFENAKREIKKAETVERLNEIETCIEYFYNDKKITEKQYLALDGIWCDQWVNLDLGGINNG